MAGLWRSANQDEWRSALEAYSERLRALGKDRLTELDEWYHALELRARTPHAYLTAEELQRIVEWKLTRGKWRPRLLDFAKAHTDDTVRQVSGKAFSCVAHATDTDSISASISSLTTLKGIGPATASAVLAAFSPACPFFSDEAGAAALDGGQKLKYTLPEYLRLADSLQSRAADLCKAEHAHSWTASDVERALWSAAAANKAVGKTTKQGKASAANRKAQSAGKGVKRKAGSAADSEAPHGRGNRQSC